MNKRQVFALLALLLGAAATAWLLIAAVTSFPVGLIAVVLILLALELAWEGIRRLGTIRVVLLLLSGASLVLSMVLMVRGQMLLDLVFIVCCAALSVVCAKQVFRLKVHLPPAPRPEHPVVVWNPNSGGGKAAAANLPEEAQSRGITAIEMTKDVDLATLVKQAIDDGADALAAAGGDGTQAIVAGIAAEHDLPFACIPAGTRNHFALDLGVDRDDVVGALDAFVSGGERRVDLATVNDLIFVNNVSVGLYAEAVAREGYRDAKVRTILATAPDVIGSEAPSQDLLWTGPDGSEHSTAAVILVSNNVYRMGLQLGAGTRPRIDDGLLGVTVLEHPDDHANSASRFRFPGRQWSATEFQIDSDGPIPVGVDGEAMSLDAPMRFAIRPGALRVRISPTHPGASPSAAQPEGLRDSLRMLARIAAGTDPLEVFAHRVNSKHVSAD